MVLTDQILEQLHKKLYEKYNVRENVMDIFQNIEKFIELEGKLHIQRAIIRAVSNNSLEEQADGLHAGFQPQTFYWVCLRGQANATEAFFVNFSPKVNFSSFQRPNLLSQKYLKQYHEIRREAYQDFKDCIDAGYKVEKNYVVHEPDQPLGAPFADVFEHLVKELTTVQDCQPELALEIRISCENGIKQRFEHYCEKYHVSSNPYYLQRAYFWKNLNYEEMSEYHRLLVAAVFRNWFNPATIENELRKAYGTWPLY